MRTRESSTSTAELDEAAVVVRPEPASSNGSQPADPGLSDVPPDQLNGMEEFGPLRNWVSFDAQRGVFVCKTLNAQFEEFTCTIIGSHVVRVLKEDDGQVLCASFDRVTADTGRPGKDCATCEDLERCQLRWWLAWHDRGTGEHFAHTLSKTASLNFTRYANALLKEELLPSQVLTRIFVEEARRIKTNTVYRRVQFERVS